jgi:hypothetical protein
MSSINKWIETNNSVVLAAYSVSAALRAASNTNGGDRRAAEAENSSNVLYNDTQKSKDCRTSSRASLET